MVDIDNEDDMTSGEECNIENGKQSDPLVPTMPPKVGEVLAVMHTTLVQKVVRMFNLKLEKAKTRREVTTRGVYLKKALGSYVCSLTIPIFQIGQSIGQHTMKAEIIDLADGLLDKALLCHSLGQMLKREMH